MKIGRDIRGIKRHAISVFYYEPEDHVRADFQLLFRPSDGWWDSIELTATGMRRLRDTLDQALAQAAKRSSTHE